jgi:hypothetical protein
MPKVSLEERQKKFSEKIVLYDGKIKAILKKEDTVLKNLPRVPEEAAVSRLGLAENMFDLTSYYVIECKIFHLIFNKQNEDLLNEARKILYKGVAYIEELVSPWIDVPFSDYGDKVAMLAGVSRERRYMIIRKMGLAIDLLKDVFGDNSKWKWSFVILDGRLAAVAKNMLDMRNTVVNLDPRSDGYETTVFHLRTAKRLLALAAERFREKYELSSHMTEDFQQAINFLNALKRLCILVDERSEAEELKRTVEVWGNKLREDIRRKKGATKEW